MNLHFIRKYLQVSSIPPENSFNEFCCGIILIPSVKSGNSWIQSRNLTLRITKLPFTILTDLFDNPDLTNFELYN